MVFYVVRGARDSCGRGCDSWVAVEGQVDSTAAIRFKRFLRQLGNRDLPIYLSSPGGNLDQALAMGGMLRERRATARVGRTLVSECGFEAQDGHACLQLKQSSRELRGELFTRGATCNSACPYMMLGATTREVAPDAQLAVHSAKVVMHFRNGAPTEQVRAAAAERGRERADRMLASYIVNMGADIGLFDLANSIKFENVHVLTREEILRFGIDRRELVETNWKFESGTRSMARKAAVTKGEGTRSWRLSQWRIICAGSEQFELDFQRVAETAASRTVALSFAGATQQFPYPAAKSQGYEIWAMRLTRLQAQSLAEAPLFEFTETLHAADGRRMSRTAKYSTDGLTAALTSLGETCPTPRNVVLRQGVGSHESAAK
jgi:hypothetical protein